MRKRAPGAIATLGVLLVALLWTSGAIRLIGGAPAAAQAQSAVTLRIPLVPRNVALEPVADQSVSYANGTYGYSLAFPAGWVVWEATDGSVVHFSPPDVGNPLEAPAPSIAVRVIDSPFAPVEPRPGVEDIRDVSAAGAQGVRFETFDAVPFSTSSVLLPFGSRTLMLRSANDPAITADLDALLATLRFTDAEVQVASAAQVSAAPELPTARVRTAQAVVDVPTINQMTEPGGGSCACGPSSAAMVLRKYGFAGKLTDFAHRGECMFILDVRDLLRDNSGGAVTGAYFSGGSLDLLRAETDAGRPVIVLIPDMIRLPEHKRSLGHYVVVRGFDDGGNVVFNDPALGKQQTQSASGFATAWGTGSSWARPWQGITVSYSGASPGTRPPSAPTPGQPRGASVAPGAELEFSWQGSGDQFQVDFWIEKGRLVGTSGWVTGTSWRTAAPASPGTYRWRVKARNAGGESGWSATSSFVVAPSRPSYDAATYAGESWPFDGVQLSAGTTFAKSWRLRNTGSSVWTPGSYRATRVAGTFGPPTLTLTAPTETNREGELSGRFDVPSGAGNHRATYRLEGPAGAFGPEFWVQIVVAGQTTDNASYASEGAPYDNANVAAGAAFTKRWTIRNSGTSTWSTTGYHAKRVGGSYGPDTIALGGSVSPNAAVDIAGAFTAPTTPGTHRAAYRMEGPGGVFGQEFWVQVVVPGASDCLPGRSVDRSFFADLLPQIGASTSAFALDALQAWQPYENTGACWNPLATTQPMPGSTDFNSARVKNYPDRATGIAATAVTLKNGHYEAILAALRLQSFDRAGVEAALRTWIGSPAYANRLASDWQVRWNNRDGGGERPGTDDAAFVSEGPPYDNATVARGAVFTKRWTIRNTGTTTWTRGSYRARRVGGGFGPESIDLSGSASPGSTAGVSGTFTAPATAGTHRATYRMEGPGGRFGQEFWVQVVVGDEPGGEDGATFVSEGPPYDNAVVGPGSTFTKQWTIRNSGSTTWTSGAYRARRVGGSYGPDVIGLGGSVGPGSTTSVAASFAAPSNAGTHRATYRMEGPAGRFGQEFWVQVVVREPETPRTDNAAFVSEGPPYDNAVVGAGSSFTKRWTVRNTGDTTWGSGYYAQRVSGSYGPDTIGFGGSVGPNGTVDLTASFTAPSSAGTHRATYRMRGPGGAFGQEFWVQVVVQPPQTTDGATFVGEGPPYDNAVVGAGSTLTKRWTLRNSGTSTWGPGHYAVRVGGSYGPDTIGLGRSVEPNATVDLTASFAAPTSGGTHRATYRMRGPGGLFGQEFWVQIVVQVQTTDGASFVSEGPPYDNATVGAGSSFTKRWTIRNSGTSTWDGGTYRARRVGGSYGPETIGFGGSVGPNGTVDLTGSFTAPSSSGTHRATYRMEGPRGAFGQEFWVQVVVQVQQPTNDNATFVSEGPPYDNNTVGAGSSFTKCWTIRNSGDTTWDGSFRAARTGGDYGPGSIGVGTTSPGSTASICGSFTAPSNGGTHRATYRMEGPRGRFGQEFWVQVVVQVQQPTNDNATFVSEGAPFDNTRYNRNASFNKCWTVRNSGNTTWDGSFRARRTGGSYGPSSIGISTTSPGNTVNVCASFTAPGSAGTHRATYRMEGPRGTFGQEFWVQIVVR